MPKIRGHEQLGDVRVLDIVAKTAKTTARDTARVLVAVRLVCQQLDLTLEDLVPDTLSFELTRPTPENVAACEQAYNVLKANGARALDAIIALK